MWGGVVGEQVEDRHAVGNDANICFGQVIAHEFERGASSEEYGISGFDDLGGGPSRGALLLDGSGGGLFLTGASTKKRASSCSAGKPRSAVHVYDEALLGNFDEIAANGHVRYVQGIGDHLDRHRLMLLEQVEYHLLALGLHGVSVQHTTIEVNHNYQTNNAIKHCADKEQ